MQQRFTVPPHTQDQGGGVLELCLRGNALLHIADITSFHAALVGGGMKDGLLFRSGHLSDGQMHSHALQFSKLPQQSLFFRRGRISTQHHHSAISISENEISFSMQRAA